MPSYLLEMIKSKKNTKLGISFKPDNWKTLFAYYGYFPVYLLFRSELCLGA